MKLLSIFLTTVSLPLIPLKYKTTHMENKAITQLSTALNEKMKSPHTNAFKTDSLYFKLLVYFSHIYFFFFSSFSLKIIDSIKIEYSCHLPLENIPSNLNILYINIRSLRNKLIDLSQFLQYNPNVFHIIILNETWLKKNELEYFNLPHYVSYHSVREKHGVVYQYLFARKSQATY